MDIVFGYPLIGEFEIIWQAQNTYWHMLGILHSYNNLHRWPCHTIHRNHCEVECCTLILILSSKKIIRFNFF